MNKKAHGIREELRELAKPDHVLYPRMHRMPGTVEFYLRGTMADRPMYGIRAMAKLAENMLHSVKFGKRNRSAEAYAEVSAFYADTRRCIADLLTACPVAKRLPKKTVDRFAERYRGLVERFARTLELVASETKVVMWLRLRKADAELLRALVVEADRNGLVPENSQLKKLCR